ncbi:hypothetical protein OFEAOIEE_LOCUS2216 [Methylorubrum extorquens]|uniref:Uncharacterized protein n=1 Tax=Methylorubrum extorquens (strain CM4 / NCIMB 13688) TaxID=440085 RepID=B7KWA2_METC4|nr:hypothetical protein Mchl_3639 [Methylorubrum extorquens CM4]
MGPGQDGAVTALDRSPGPHAGVERGASLTDKSLIRVSPLRLHQTLRIAAVANHDYWAVIRPRFG